MPTYEYKCEHCGYGFEQLQSITARSLRKCPRCRKNGLKRLIGMGAGIIFKGAGFYATDYRSPSYQSGEKKEKAPAKPAGETKPSADKTTGTKPDSKTKKK